MRTPRKVEDALIGRPQEGCYCDLWKTDPGALREQGLPEGYCGFCSSEVDGRPCGRPGHLHSGPGPFTFGYCDRHPPGYVIHFGNVLVVGLILVGAIGLLLWWYL
jgi:hypothetical protein